MTRELERFRLKATRQDETLAQVVGPPQAPDDEVHKLRRQLLDAQKDTEELRRQLLEYKTFLPDPAAETAEGEKVAERLAAGAEKLAVGEADRTGLVNVLLKAQRVVEEAERREQNCSRKWAALLAEAKSAREAVKELQKENEALAADAAEKGRAADAKVQRLLGELGTSLDDVDQARAAQTLIAEGATLREEKRQLEARYEKYRKECVRLKTKLMQEMNDGRQLEVDKEEELKHGNGGGSLARVA